jgi:hypothetical protein
LPHRPSLGRDPCGLGRLSGSCSATKKRRPRLPWSRQSLAFGVAGSPGPGCYRGHARGKRQRQCPRVAGAVRRCCACQLRARPNEAIPRGPTHGTWWARRRSSPAPQTTHSRRCARETSPRARSPRPCGRARMTRQRAARRRPRTWSRAHTARTSSAAGAPAAAPASRFPPTLLRVQSEGTSRGDKDGRVGVYPRSFVVLPPYPVFPRYEVVALRSRIGSMETFP